MGGEIAVDDLPTLREELELPSTVYVRAVFVDNPAAVAEDDLDITWGVWVGGLDLSNGLTDDVPLTPVTIEVGQGNLVKVPLTALRKLDVTVSSTASPEGNGQGPLSVIALDTEVPTDESNAFGIAEVPCADVSGGQEVELSGFVLGTGPYWVAGMLRDLNTEGDLPPGSLAAIDFSGASPVIPVQLTYGETDYVVSVAIDLTHVQPVPGDAGTPDVLSCDDILGDGGAP